MLLRGVRCGLGGGSLSVSGFGLASSSYESCLDRLAGSNGVWQTTTMANGLQTQSVSGTQSSLSGHIPGPKCVSHPSRDGKASSQWPAREIFGFGADNGSHGVASSGSKTQDLWASSKLSPSQLDEASVDSLISSPPPLSPRAREHANFLSLAPEYQVPVNLNIYYSEFGITNSCNQRSGSL
jgi:hypothetical protein